MPHVEIIGAGSARELAGELAGFAEEGPALIARVLDVYHSTDGRRLLLEAVVVEGYLRQTFFLLVREEQDGVLIRCHPASAVQKTDGVKTLIARLAHHCLAQRPGSRVGHTNLQAWLARPGA